jgi:hypothetical protein
MGLKKSTCRVTLLPNPCNIADLANQWASKAALGATVDCLDNLLDDLMFVVALYDTVTQD